MRDYPTTPLRHRAPFLWVAGKAADQPEDADVELDEVERLYTAHDMWTAAFA